MMKNPSKELLHKHRWQTIQADPRISPDPPGFPRTPQTQGLLALGLFALAVDSDRNGYGVW